MEWLVNYKRFYDWAIAEQTTGSTEWATVAHPLIVRGVTWPPVLHQQIQPSILVTFGSVSVAISVARSPAERREISATKFCSSSLRAFSVSLVQTLVQTAESDGATPFVPSLATVELSTVDPVVAGSSSVGLASLSRCQPLTTASFL